MRLSRFFLPILLGIGITSVAGCGNRLIKTDPDVTSGRKKIAIIWDFKDQNPTYVRTGQGTLNYITSEFTKAPWIANIESFKAGPAIVGEFDRLWKPELTKRGINFVFVKDAANLNDKRLTPVPNDLTFFADVKEIPGAKDSDYVVVYEVKSFKVVHDHLLFGIASISNPSAELEYRVTVVRASDNKIVGETTQKTTRSFDDGWDKGPEYMLIYKSLINTISDSITAIYTQVMESSS